MRWFCPEAQLGTVVPPGQGTGTKAPGQHLFSLCPPRVADTETADLQHPLLSFLVMTEFFCPAQLEPFFGGSEPLALNHQLLLLIHSSPPAF